LTGTTTTQPASVEEVMRHDPASLLDTFDHGQTD
jgi:hypothetical protein